MLPTEQLADDCLPVGLAGSQDLLSHRLQRVIMTMQPETWNRDNQYTSYVKNSISAVYKA